MGGVGSWQKDLFPFNGPRNIVIELESPFLLTSNFLLHLSITEHQLATQKLTVVKLKYWIEAGSTAQLAKELEPLNRVYYSNREFAHE